MNTLEWQLKQYPPLRIAEDLTEQESVLSGLPRLVGGTLHSQQQCSAPDALLKTAKDGLFHFRFDDEQQFCRSTVKLPKNQHEQVLIWRWALRTAAINRVLCGQKLMLMHGCLLKLSDGEGLFLCGQSGMGKSTTAKRYQAAGGSCPADDMILLEYSGAQLYAHPMPTWSRCLNSLEGEYFPLETALPVKSILTLSRDDAKEEIREVEGFKYMTALYASCALFQLNVLKKLTKVHQDRLAKMMQNCAENLYRRFPHRTLFANLQGDIMQTIGGI